MSRNGILQNYIDKYKEAVKTAAYPSYRLAHEVVRNLGEVEVDFGDPGRVIEVLPPEHDECPYCGGSAKNKHGECRGCGYHG